MISQLLKVEEQIVLNFVMNLGLEKTSFPNKRRTDMVKLKTNSILIFLFISKIKFWLFCSILIFLFPFIDWVRKC